MLNSSILKYFTSIVIVLLLLQNNTVGAVNLHKLQQQSKTAPAETSQFGQLVGNWEITDSGIDKDGNWKVGNGADWNFYWILNGTAIQDDWIAPSLDKPAPEKGRQFGTNIRIYNPKMKRWDTAWASNTGAKIDTFSATLINGALVMQGHYYGKETKISFYNISTNHFSWKMEQQNKDTKLWNEVYRIEGERTL